MLRFPSPRADHVPHPWLNTGGRQDQDSCYPCPYQLRSPKGTNMNNRGRSGAVRSQAHGIQSGQLQSTLEGLNRRHTRLLKSGSTLSGSGLFSENSPNPVSSGPTYEYGPAPPRWGEPALSLSSNLSDLHGEVSPPLVNCKSRHFGLAQCPTEAAPFSPTSSYSAKRDKVNGRISSCSSSLATV